MNRLEQYISISPEICHGQPCFANTRIMVYLVLEMLEDGASFEEIHEAYPDLTPEHIKAALHYAAKVLEEHEFRPALLE